MSKALVTVLVLGLLFVGQCNAFVPVGLPILWVSCQMLSRQLALHHLMSVQAIFDKHLAIINDLYEGIDSPKAIADLKALIDNAAAFLKGNQSRNYNYIYDQIVSIGEFISTTIVSGYANAIGLANTLLDVKQVLFTDNAYTEGVVDFKKTEKAIADMVNQLVKSGFVITQGFVGSSP